MRRTDARSGTWELLFCAMTEPTLVNVVEINGENGRNYFNVLVGRVNAPKKSLRGMEYNAGNQQNDLEIFSLRANIFRVANSSYECIPRSLQWVFVGVIEGRSTTLWRSSCSSTRNPCEFPQRLLPHFETFPAVFDDIDISKNINPAQFQQPLTFPLLPTSAQDGTLCHGRDPLHGNGALRSLKAEYQSLSPRLRRSSSAK